MYKIRKIRFIDHPVLKNLELDFCDANENPVDTVLFAGENGTGKSTIIDAIYKATSFSPDWGFPLNIELEIDGKRVNIAYYWHSWDKSQKAMLYVNDHLGMDSYIGSSDTKDRYGFSSIFSDVDINFHANDVSTVTSLTLDSTSSSRRSNTDLPRQINQLLIDIQALDDADVAFAARENQEKTIKELQIEERIPRFTKAFNRMFDDLSYSRVTNRNGKKAILFRKNGVDVTIDSLSSGEKQVVYRGCFLLKDVNAMNGAFVFIDEPEISLHPTWQMKIMDYYKGIFTNEEGVQTSQIFAVTHSPFVIHNENRRNDKVIVLARDEQGNVIVKDKPEYYKCDSIEAVQDAFSIQSFSADKPTVYLEGRTDEMYFNKALEVFGMTVPFQFKCVGHIDERGKEFNTGDKSVDAAFQFLVSRNLPFKNFCLKDCDTHREPQKRNNTIILSIPPYENGKGIRKGIENALVLDNVDLTPYYICKKTRGEYGEQKEIESFEKMACCNGICALSDNILVEVFAHLKDTIDELVRLYYEE